jgi:putative hydrolase of the HAD superfamily
MIKAILFDADGVVLKARERFFSERLAEKQGVPVAEVLPFFKTDMRLAFTNKADIKKSLEEYLPKWGWTGSVDDFLEHWFSEESPRDEEVIQYVDSLRASGIKCYLATDREPNWSQYLVDRVQLKDHFDGFFFSYDIGYEKHTLEYFQEVIARLALSPEEIQYWDDDQKNVDVAKEAGIDARLWSGLDQLKQ